MKTIEQILERYLATKTDEQVKEILKDLDKAVFDAFKEEEARLNKAYEMVQQGHPYIKEMSNRTYQKLRG